MASNIDATKPTFGTADTASVRANFAAAKAEIEALQSGKLDISYAATIASIQSIIATIETEIDAIQASQLADEADIAVLKSDVEAIKTRVTNLEAKDVDLQSQINSILGSISTINTSASLLTARVTALEADSTAQASRLSALEATVNTPSSGIQADLNSTKARVTALESADVFQISSSSAQLLAGNFNAQTVIDFDSASVNSPSGAFSFDSVTNEIIIISTGYYSVTLMYSFFVDPAGHNILTKHAVWGAGKPPSGFGFSAIDGSTTTTEYSEVTQGQSKKELRTITFCFRVQEPNTLIKFFQAGLITELSGAGGTPNVGISQTASSGVFPDSKSCTVFIQRIGS